MSFSIMNIVNQTMGITLQNIVRVYLVFIATILIALVLGLVLGLLGPVLSAFITVPVGAVLFLALFGAVFNYWIRLGAVGADGALEPFKTTFQSGFVNGVKLFFITLLLGVVILVITGVLALVGVAPDTAPNVDMSQIQTMGAMEVMQTFFAAQAEQALSFDIVALQLVSTLIICFVYSFFSANLTRTALGSTAEGLEHPHTTDFAVALVIIYLAVLIPSILVMIVQSAVLALAVQLLIGLPVTAAIGIAHGVRYRLCTGEVAYEAAGGPEQDDG